jgi:probable phosphoglycerate mutase
MAETLWLIRHGETEWSVSGAHTGRTDIALTSRGRQLAARVGGYLANRKFELVLTSPLRRAKDTCRLAGYGPAAIVDGDLQEWDYGAYEGRTTADIRNQRPGWDLWRDGVVDGETIEDVAARARRVIDRTMAASGDAAIFAHGHILRVLTACWLQLDPRAGCSFSLETASLSVLGFERDTPVMRLWNRVFADDRRV